MRVVDSVRLDLTAQRIHGTVLIAYLGELSERSTFRLAHAPRNLRREATASSVRSDATQAKELPEVEQVS